MFKENQYTQQRGLHEAEREPPTRERWRQAALACLSPSRRQKEPEGYPENRSVVIFLSQSS